MLARIQGNEHTAHASDISEKIVRNHSSNIHEKPRIHGRTRAVRYASRKGP